MRTDLARAALQLHHSLRNRTLVADGRVHTVVSTARDIRPRRHRDRTAGVGLRRRRRAAEAPLPTTPFRLTAQQVEFFRTFGFLVLPGLFTHEIDRIAKGFEEAFATEKGIPLDPDNPYHRSRDSRFEREPRWTLPAFLERSPDLAWLREDQRLRAVAEGLLGDDYGYAESDGNLFNCDVSWHIDAYGAIANHDHIKVFFYLDPLLHDTGALRVLPGSHHGGAYTRSLRRQLIADPAKIPEIFGVDRDGVPSWTLEVEPGDVIVSDFRTLHASFNGKVRRRLFTVNYGSRQDRPAPPG